MQEAKVTVKNAKVQEGKKVIDGYITKPQSKSGGRKMKPKIIVKKTTEI